VGSLYIKCEHPDPTLGEGERASRDDRSAVAGGGARHGGRRTRTADRGRVVSAAPREVGSGRAPGASAGTRPAGTVRGAWAGVRGAGVSYSIINNSTPLTLKYREARALTCDRCEVTHTDTRRDNR